MKKILLIWSTLIVASCSCHANDDNIPTISQQKELKLKEEYIKDHENDIIFGMLPETFTQDEVNEMLKCKPLKGNEL